MKTKYAFTLGSAWLAIALAAPLASHAQTQPAPHLAPPLAYNPLLAQLQSTNPTASAQAAAALLRAPVNLKILHTYWTAIAKAESDWAASTNARADEERPLISLQKKLTIGTYQYGFTEMRMATGGGGFSEYRVDPYFIIVCSVNNLHRGTPQERIVHTACSAQYRPQKWWSALPDNFTGTHTSYFSTGELSAQRPYRNRQLHGLDTHYTFDEKRPKLAVGKLAYTQMYRQHKGHGEGRGYYPSGELKYRIRYQNNEQTQGVLYDTKGKIISRFKPSEKAAQDSN
jgi:hypothetical protein